MIKKCFEIFVRGEKASVYSEFVFALDIEEAKFIAHRQPFGSLIIKISVAKLDGLVAS